MKISGPKLATLTGAAVGDALGMPFETKHHRDPDLLRWKGDYQASAFHRLQPGQWTDGIVAGKALAESLLAHRTYAPADAAKRYADWYRLGDTDRRGRGKTTEKALARLSHNLPWTQSGDPDSVGCGSAERAVPLGVLFRNNIQAAAEMAKVDSQITHRHDECLAGATAVAVAVAHLLQGRTQPENIILRVLDWVPKGTQMHAKLLQAKAVSGRLLKPGSAKSQLLIELGTSAQVFETVPAALVAFAATTSFREAVETAVRAGGDTDSTAAIAGALAGTFYGIEQVAPYLECLEAAPELRALEQNLFAAAPQHHP